MSFPHYEDAGDGMRPQGSDAALLREIRDRRSYAYDQWSYAREQRAIDIRYLAGDPWSPEDRERRRKAGRPCINHDELNQYTNQIVNGLRKNKRGIKIDPAGGGASRKTARLHQDIIRTIENRSHATAAYIRCFQDAVEGGYGAFRISRDYVSDDSFAQRIVILPIQNPDSVLYDPDCKRPDWSDAQYVFVQENIPRDEFKSRYPNAKITSFSSEDIRTAPQWITEQTVLVCEYWRIETTPARLYKLADGRITEQLPEGEQAVLSRKVSKRKVVQYITNGIEILERKEELGSRIPIIFCTGKELWQLVNGAYKRVLLSAVRLARDPQMSLAYYVTQEAEEAAQTPIAPVIGYVGQFESDREAWDEAAKVPHARLEVDAVTDATGQQVLPLPQRQSFTPNFNQYELAKESARRSVQAAMGNSPLPTSAQRQNEKSGVALERIAESQAAGSYHFYDNFENALSLAGEIIEDWIPTVYADKREEALVMPDENTKVVMLNSGKDADGNELPHVSEGRHGVTVTTAPSFQSQEQEQQEFLEGLVANLGNLPVAPPQAAKLLSMAIKMRNLGPQGDEMAEIISPSDGEDEQQLSPRAQQQIQQAQQQLQALNAHSQQLEQALQELQQEKAAKVVDNEYRMRIEELKIQADLAKAEITTKAQVASERMALLEETVRQLQQMAHEAGMQAQDQAHQRDMTERQAAITSQQAEQERQAAQEQAESEPAEQSE